MEQATSIRLLEVDLKFPKIVIYYDAINIEIKQI